MRPARHIATVAALAGAGWLAVLAGGMFLPGAAPAALVLMPAPGLLDRLPDARLLSAGRLTMTVTGVETTAIYAAGAVLVLPAGLPLCVDPGRAGAGTTAAATAGS